VLNSYRGNGGGNHLTVGAGISADELKNRIVDATQKDIRYYLTQWLKKKGVYAPQADSNWKIIPVEDVKAAMPNDFQMLFGEKPGD